MPFLIPNNDNDDRQVDIYDEHQKSCACQLAGVWTKALCLRWRRRLLIAPYQKQTQAKLKANLNQTQSHTVEHPIHNRFGKASNFRFENCCSNNGSKLQNFEDNLLNRNNLVSAAERIKWPVVFFVVLPVNSIMIQLNFLILKHFARLNLAVLSILTHFQLNSPVNYLVIAEKKTIWTIICMQTWQLVCLCRWNFVPIEIAIFLLNHFSSGHFFWGEFLSYFYFKCE